MRSGSLFTGSGILDRVVHDTLGATPAWFAENNPAAAKVLTHHWPAVPNLGNVTDVDWSVVEPVDVLCGGFPCQDVSTAGKRIGMRPGTRSGLWSHMTYAISQLRPRLVVIENVRGLLSADAACDLEPCPWCVGDGEGRPLRALGGVLGDLAQLGYDARWCGLPAADVGAPHGRFRVFIVAQPAGHASVLGWNPAQFAERGGESPWSTRGSSLATAAHAPGIGRRRRDHGLRPEGPVEGTTTDSESNGRDQGRPEPARQLGGSDAALGGDGDFDWGIYEPAVRRWESILGRSAPAPTLTGKHGGQQLSPNFVEWMMGWPKGWVTAVPGLTRNDQLRICGNGVVPQQVNAALRWLLDLRDEESVA